ncbi:MAG: hypothetical protein K0R38_6413 [Polyangiaceae bacterium]|jgi:hypothetical protein|nr:hypothetical protein [Polyangiaceae bacterium]
MPIRTIANLAVKRHFGSPTSITFILAPLVAPLNLGEIEITKVESATTTEGVIGIDTDDDAARIDVLAHPLKFAELVVLAALPNTVKLTVTVTYEDASTPMKMTDITCRRVAVATKSAGAVPLEDATPAE